jgi:ubiquinone/menaquinone biosynthesis C-methylase UbiE
MKLMQKLKKGHEKLDLDQIKKTLGDRFSFTADDTHAVLKTITLPESAKVLDVGTGLGNMAIMLALHGYDVVTGEPEHDDSIYSKQDWLSGAEKVNVDNLIRFQAFDASVMPFEANRFDGIFFLGSLHHIPENNRTKVFRESIRTSKAEGVICFFEPNKNLIEMIRKNDPSHPDPADPGDYVHGLQLSSRKITGKLFDAFVFEKQTA